MENVYNYIRKLREENRYSQQDVADKIGISQTAYRHIENGDTKLTIDRIFEFAKIFKVKPEDILYGEYQTTKVDKSSIEILEKRILELEELSQYLRSDNKMYRSLFLDLAGSIKQVFENIESIDYGQLNKKDQDKMTKIKSFISRLAKSVNSEDGFLSFTYGEKHPWIGIEYDEI
jgi:transcriptional regulator with XRE-family HTH domain